jgi:hypothetical protein
MIRSVTIERSDTHRAHMSKTGLDELVRYLTSFMSTSPPLGLMGQLEAFRPKTDKKAGFRQFESSLELHYLE